MASHDTESNTASPASENETQPTTTARDTPSETTDGSTPPSPSVSPTNNRDPDTFLDAIPVETSPDAKSNVGPHEACPACGTIMDVSTFEPLSNIRCPNCGQGCKVRRKFRQFQIIKLIGQGGMGAVYEAFDCNLNRRLALKILKKDLLQNEADRNKLAREAKITSSVTHPNVVKVFSFGQDHGLFYMAMELVEKGSLDDLIYLQGKLAEIQVLEIAIQIAGGLKTALDRGLIHRDIKPGNILFADAHTAKLVDFGLAVVMDEAAAASGEIWGTPYYIAPEKLDNQPEDFRSDIYSLGGSLFHALAGRPPYEAETASMVALKQLKSQPVSLQSFAPDVSSETAYVINRMLAKDPQDRYQSYDELIEHLTFARQKLLERINKPPQPKPRVVLETKETRTFSALLTLILLVAATISGLLLYIFRSQLFGENNPQTTQTSSALANFTPSFETAVRANAAGRHKEALTQFQSLAAIPELPQPKKNWVLMNQGLAAILDGNLQTSAATFDSIRKAGLYSDQPDQLPMANFFVEAAKFLARPNQPIGLSKANLFKSDNYEAFALLCFAMHDWQLGDVLEATNILRRVSRAQQITEIPWLSLYQPLISRYDSDGMLLRKLAAKAAAARSPDETQTVLKEIEAARPSITTGAKAQEQLDNLRSKLLKKPD